MFTIFCNKNLSKTNIILNVPLTKTVSFPSFIFTFKNVAVNNVQGERVNWFNLGFATRLKVDQECSPAILGESAPTNMCPVTNHIPPTQGWTSALVHFWKKINHTKRNAISQSSIEDTSTFSWPTFQSVPRMKWGGRAYERDEQEVPSRTEKAPCASEFPGWNIRRSINEEMNQHQAELIGIPVRNVHIRHVSRPIEPLSSIMESESCQF